LVEAIAMKEFDFLPEWYKGGRRRQISWRAQYIALAGMFVVMVVWNFIAGHSVSKATAQLAEITSKQAEVKNASSEFDTIKNRAEQLRVKANILNEIDSKIDVASVLGELSFLIDRKIALKKVDFKAERFGEVQGTTTGRGSMVRADSRWL
jgi:Tfp pilus assembly protein PilN